MPRFIRSTIVEPLIKIRQERLLPMRGEVVARVGQEVSPGQVVARSSGELDFVVIPVSEKLRIVPDDIEKYLQVQIGEPVEQGTVLVEQRRLIGGKTLVSPVEGSLYDVKNGRLIIQRATDRVELRALLQGRVVNQIPGRGVVLEAHGSLIQGVWGSGKEGVGPLKVVARGPDSILQMGQLDAEVTNKVVIAGRINQPDVLEKAAQLEVRGIILGSMSSALCQMAGSLPFPVILTDGIGQQRMALPVFQLLQQAEGREASIFGRFPDALGNRPEIVIPGTAVSTTDPPSNRKLLAVGQTVRILRTPYSSQVGQVVNLYTYAQLTPIGIRARGADVKLPDGNVVFVPYANLDAII